MGKKNQLIIHSNAKYKILWDVFVIALLIFVCVVLPYRLTFVHEENESTKRWEVAYYIMDSFFLIDIILTFFTSIPDVDKMNEITDKKIIATRYIYTWFFIDSVSIIPFDVLIKMIMENAKL